MNTLGAPVPVVRLHDPLKDLRPLLVAVAAKSGKSLYISAANAKAAASALKANPPT